MIDPNSGPPLPGPEPDISGAIRWAVNTAIRVIPGVVHGGPRGPTDNQQQVLIDAGYTRNEVNAGRARMVTWTSPDGTVIGNETARGVARGIIRALPAAPFVPGSIYNGSKGPINPRNPPPKQLPGPPPDYEPPEDKYGGWIGGPKCGTDTQCAEYEADHPGSEFQGFAPGTWSKPPDWEVIARPVPGVIGGILSRIFVLGSILFPSRTADDDVWDPEWVPKRKGPKKRPKIRTRTPAGDPWPDPEPQARPYPMPNPGTRPGTLPRTTGAPTSYPFPMPRTPTTRGPLPAPAPPATPTWFDPLLPALLLLAQPRPRTPRTRLPRTPELPRPTPIDAMQPFAFAQPMPRERDCDCTKTKKRKDKDKCTNPILRKRHGTNSAGQRTITTTRLDRCQA